MAPVIRALREQHPAVETIVCSTGQHREMLKQALDLFDITPNIELQVMLPNQSLAALTGTLCAELDTVIDEVRPDWILAPGDTTSVLVSALLAFYRRIRFGHVEAGLRTGDLHHPFPEELNRWVADRLSACLFAPTERAREALRAEGYPDDRILVTGNTGIDALLQIAAMPYDRSTGPLAALPNDTKVVLVTAHRRESFGERFSDICLALRDLAVKFATDGVHFLYPVHLNPNVQKPVRTLLADLPNVSLIHPLDYVSLVNVLKEAVLVLTDSGGIQEEAPSFGVPVLVMRDTTERPEGVEAGVSRLVGTTRERITAEAGRLLRSSAARAAMTGRRNPYGDGHAAPRIVRRMLDS